MNNIHARKHEIEGGDHVLPAYPCFSDVEVLQAVVLDVTGELYQAIASSSANVRFSRVLGFVSSKDSTTVARVRRSGDLGGFTGLVAGDLYYLSATTEGAITNVKPIHPKRIIPVGIAVSATVLNINIDLSFLVVYDLPGGFSHASVVLSKSGNNVKNAWLSVGEVTTNVGGPIMGYTGYITKIAVSDELTSRNYTVRIGFDSLDETTFTALVNVVNGVGIVDFADGLHTYNPTSKLRGYIQATEAQGARNPVVTVYMKYTS